MPVDLVRDSATAVPATTTEWRARSTAVALHLALVATLPLLLYGLRSESSLALRMFFFGSWGLLLLLALLRRADPRVRAVGMMVIAYATAVFMLAHVGLGGAGRALLVGMPFYALLLLGRGPGLAAAGASMAVYGVFTAIAYSGWEPVHPSVGGSTWLVQGLALALVIAPLGVLGERALAFQEETLARARAASGTLAEELGARQFAVRRLQEEVGRRRELEHRLLEVAERERRLAGQALHDGVCQQLTAGTLRARLLERELAARGAPEAAHAEVLAELVEAALTDSRRLVHGLWPGPLPAGGLDAALSDLARQVRETVEVDCDYTAEGAPSLPVPVATQLYRIAQEATWNAVKHASPSRIDIHLATTGGEVRITVSDDGRGMDPSAEPGLGQRSMADRAQSLGGVLLIGAAPDGLGTRVTCRVPGLLDGRPA